MHKRGEARWGDVSSSVLNERLRELREERIIATRPAGGYLLTADSQDLLGALTLLDGWAERWTKRAQIELTVRKSSPRRTALSDATPFPASNARNWSPGRVDIHKSV